MLAGILGGILRVYPNLSGQTYVSQFVGQTIVVKGKISEDPDLSSSTPVIRLKDFSIYPSSAAEDLANLPETPKISGTFYVTLASKVELERSDIITIRGKLGSSFGTFAGSFYRAELLQYERTDTGDIFARFKQGFARRVRDILPSPEVDLGLGYLMGVKTGLSEDFSEALQAVGMTHVVVASGAHLAILIGAAKRLFGKISKFAGILGALLLIAAFVLIVGFTPSMTRAALVASLSLLMGFAGRRFTPLRLIGFVAALTLLFDPSFLLNLGWQLSFASFFGILVLAPRLTKSFYGGKSPPWLASMLITSISTSLVCAPILIYNFGSLSLLSLVANLIILPTLPYVMFLMMLVGGFSFWPIAAGVIAWPTKWLLDLHIFVVNFLSEQTTFILTIPAEDWRIYLLYIPILVYLLYGRLRSWVIFRRRGASLLCGPKTRASAPERPAQKMMQPQASERGQADKLT